MEIVAWILEDPIPRTTYASYTIKNRNDLLFTKLCYDLFREFNLKFRYKYEEQLIRDGHSSTIEKKVIFTNGKQWYENLISNLGVSITTNHVKKYVKISKPIYTIEGNVILFLLEPQQAARVIDYDAVNDIVILCKDMTSANIKEAQEKQAPIYKCYNSKSFILLN